MDNFYYKEKEIKVLKTSYMELKSRLSELNAEFISEEIQINYVLENPEKTFPSGDYLRIRQINPQINGGRIELTYKEKTESKQLRESNELTVEINDLNSGLKLLRKLGFQIKAKAEKHRISFSLMGSRLDFDTWKEMDYPEPYLEIEVSEDLQIQKIVKLLGIEEKEISLLSIEELKEQKKKA